MAIRRPEKWMKGVFGISHLLFLDLPQHQYAEKRLTDSSMLKQNEIADGYYCIQTCNSSI